MKMNNAIFDLDGTLLDSMPVWDTLAVRYLHQNGKEPKPGLRAILATLAMVGSAEYLIEEYGIRKDVQTVIDEMNEIGLVSYRDEVLPKEGVIPFLETLRSKGVNMCVATATDRPLVEAALKRLNMMQYFQRIFTCTEVGASKRRPDIFYAAMEDLDGTKENTVIFEDSLHAIETAKAAGFRVAAVPDASAQKDRTQIQALADEWFETYAQAMEAVAQEE